MTRDTLLHALHVPAGWLIEYNQFYDMPVDHPLAWSVVCKDTLLMLRHVRRDVLVDLSWTPPEEPDGGYRLCSSKVIIAGRRLLPSRAAIGLQRSGKSNDCSTRSAVSAFRR